MVEKTEKPETFPWKNTFYNAKRGITCQKLSKCAYNIFTVQIGDAKNNENYLKSDLSAIVSFCRQK